MLRVAPDGAAALSEAQFRTGNVALRATLEGVRWAPLGLGAMQRALQLSIDSVPAKLAYVETVSDTELILTVQHNPTLDVQSDAQLTLRVINLCGASPVFAAEMSCIHSPENSDSSGTSSTLSASTPVRAGGAPPGRPGRPVLVSTGSYRMVRVLWSPPAATGDSLVSDYSWVEFDDGRPVLSGDLVPSEPQPDGTLATELDGYKKGYRILPGALAAINDGGFGPVSEEWPAAAMGRPARPLALDVTPIGPFGERAGGLVLEWRAPEWDGGFPLQQFVLGLQRRDGDAWTFAAWSYRGEREVTLPVAAGAASGRQQHIVEARGVDEGEYRLLLASANTQGDRSGWVASRSLRYAGGWCGWEVAGAALGCTRGSIAALVATIAALCLGGAVLSRRRRAPPVRASAVNGAAPPGELGAAAGSAHGSARPTPSTARARHRSRTLEAETPKSKTKRWT
jgi:hypothetical protein